MSASKSYLVVNIVIASIILAMIALCSIHSSGNPADKVKCTHEELLGGKCPVCGMTDGISEIVRGKFHEAQAFQQNSIVVFLFLFIQLIMRGIIIVMLKRSNISIKVIASVDITLSLLLFAVSFKTLVPQAFYIFYKMLITGI